MDTSRNKRMKYKLPKEKHKLHLSVHGEKPLSVLSEHKNDPLQNLKRNLLELEEKASFFNFALEEVQDFFSPADSA